MPAETEFKGQPSSALAPSRPRLGVLTLARLCLASHVIGYAVQETSKWDQFEVIDFKPKTFGDYDVEIQVRDAFVPRSHMTSSS